MILQSLDDPVFSDAVRDIVPLEHVKSNKHIIYMETKTGAHLGYVEGK